MNDGKASHARRMLPPLPVSSEFSRRRVGVAHPTFAEAAQFAVGIQ
jgi:hypothetical protein